MEENQKIGTNLLQKYPVSENFKKMIPKYKKKFISSYSKVGRFDFLI